VSNSPDKPPLRYRLYYDTLLIGLVTEELADLPSIHCKVELEDLTDNELMDQQLKRFRLVCAQHHQHMMDRKLSDAQALESELLEAVAPFNEQPWYIVNTESDCRTTINRPYFGVEGYLRLSYARLHQPG
jgi:hypothetical protein